MPVNFIENRTYDEIQVGDSATLTRTLRPEDIQLFAIMSGDVNPAHVDPEYAHSSMFHEVIAHGMWGGALISTVLGTEFPGPGTIYISQTLRFSRPVKVGEQLGDQWLVTEGLKPGDPVIVDGVMRIGPGAPVQVVAPQAASAPAASAPVASK